MVGYKEIARALDKSIIRIEDAVMETLSLTPPELAADIYKTGIYLAGGGALLKRSCGQNSQENRSSCICS